METRSRTTNGDQIPAFDELCHIVARLRAPDGCPWDREQTNESLLSALLEEAYEVVSAVRSGDDVNLREELGDLLLLIIMQAQIASENGRFDVADVIEGINQKLVRRHPHVFGDSEAGDSGSVLRQWERIKLEEKKGASEGYLAGLPQALPALMRAQKAQAKAARVNFDWVDPGDVMAKVEEELGEVRMALAERERKEKGPPNAASDAEFTGNVAEEIGDLLFAVVNLARKQKLDAEALLQAATNKFTERFHRMELALKDEGHKLGEADLATLDAIWNRMKTVPG